MKRSSVSELKAHLSAHLGRVKRGEEILVTERGRPIARLAPAAGAEGLSERMKRLVAAGVVRPPVRALSPELLRPSPVKDPKGLVLAALLEERRSSR
jgi:prevent-host-death family protein